MKRTSTCYWIVLALLMLLPGCANKYSASPQPLVVTQQAPVDEDNAPDNVPLQQILEEKPAQGTVSSGYGKRALKSRTVRMHKGIDISAQRGTAVVASGEGIITYAGRKKGYGKVVTIEHESGVTTLYAHLDKVHVKSGEKITAGEKLGTVGRTGRTTGPNLHFEVLLEDKPIDPSAIVDWI